MQTIEIRQNTKQIRVVTLIVAITGIILFCCMLLFTKFTYYTFLYAITGALFLLYGAYRGLSFAQKNLPLFIFSNDALEINDQGESFLFHWAEIKYYDIVKNDSTEYLAIESDTKSKRINISFIEKTPQDLKNLIGEYKNAAYLNSIN